MGLTLECGVQFQYIIYYCEILNFNLYETKGTDYWRSRVPWFPSL
jgi:hypothetical protein